MNLVQRLHQSDTGAGEEDDVVVERLQVEDLSEGCEVEFHSLLAHVTSEADEGADAVGVDLCGNQDEILEDLNHLGSEGKSQSRLEVGEGKTSSSSKKQLIPSFGRGRLAEKPAGRYFALKNSSLSDVVLGLGKFTCAGMGREGQLDPSGNIWGAPYRWGTMDWDDLWRPELAGKISMVDSPREVRYFDSMHYLKSFEAGDVWVTVGWSSDIIPAAKRMSNVAVVVPKSGASIWADLWTARALPFQQEVISGASPIALERLPSSAPRACKRKSKTGHQPCGWGASA
ncbi:hypothetical protein KSP39_PZI009773 [Platanthera zijinensis]|uniref:Uncharacterized protein n=1 Tax=Platanthera zijinensis TaxID=2320716 RepID=A0AAP0BHW6_9ASPA